METEKAVQSILATANLEHDYSQQQSNDNLPDNNQQQTNDHNLNDNTTKRI